MPEKKLGTVDIQKGKELLTQLGFDVSGWDKELKKDKPSGPRSGDIIDHEWGKEILLVVHSTYRSKLIKMIPGGKFSFHFHAKKHESIYVLSGEYAVVSVDNDIGKSTENIVKKGDFIMNPPNSPHQIRCILPGELLEISDTDDPSDIYRIGPGDNQRKTKR